MEKKYSQKKTPSPFSTNKVCYNFDVIVLSKTPFGVATRVGR